jgi:hypothetical protein
VRKRSTGAERASFDFFRGHKIHERRQGVHRNPVMSEVNLSPWNDPYGDLAIPPALEDSLRRHRENLTQLVTSLRSVGLSETQIEDSVSVLVTSYKEELLRTMKAMAR